MNNRIYYRKSLENAKKLRANQTDAESILWFHLRNRGLNNIKFRRQVPINNYITDFLCMEKKLVIELDGSQHVDNIIYDNKRSELLNSLGYKVIRIFNSDIYTNIESVLIYILQEYKNL